MAQVEFVGKETSSGTIYLKTKRPPTCLERVEMTLTAWAWGVAWATLWFLGGILVGMILK